jgi:hypothetical protein
MTVGLGAFEDVESRRIIGPGHESSQEACLEVIRRA